MEATRPPNVDFLFSGTFEENGETRFVRCAVESANVDLWKSEKRGMRRYSMERVSRFEGIGRE